ncbi:MAG: winged helix-turn-helix domain-containing protein, partial [Pseudomonadota bacterium]
MTTTYRFGHAELRPGERRLLISGEDVRLGGRAFDLLVELVEQRAEVVGKDALIERVWPGLVVEESNLSVQIAALRKVLGPDVIQTVSGR